MKVTINTQSLVLGECLMIVAANAPAYTRDHHGFRLVPRTVPPQLRTEPV